MLTRTSQYCYNNNTIHISVIHSQSVFSELCIQISLTISDPTGSRPCEAYDASCVRIHFTVRLKENTYDMHAVVKQWLSLISVHPVFNISIM